MSVCPSADSARCIFLVTLSLIFSTQSHEAGPVLTQSTVEAGRSVGYSFPSIAKSYSLFRLLEKCSPPVDDFEYVIVPGVGTGL